MLRPLLTITAALSLSCLSLAQTTSTGPEGFEIVPGRGSGNNPPGANAGYTAVIRFARTTYGEYLMQYDNDHFMGLGDMGTQATNPQKPCEIHAFRVNWTDLDTTTPEGFVIYARPETTKGSKRPDINTTIMTQSVSKPATPTTGRGSWSQTVQLLDQQGKPAPLTTDCVSTYFLGIELPVLPATTSWPNDGTAVAVSFAGSGSTGGGNYDMVKGGHSSPKLYWLVGKTSPSAKTLFPGFARYPGGGIQKMVYGYAQITNAPILQVGAWHDRPGGIPVATHGVDQGFGAAGMFPDMTTSRQDGVAFRITRNKDASGNYKYDTWAAIAVSFGTTPQLLPKIGAAPVSLTPIGRLYLGPLPWLLPVTVSKLAVNNADTIIKYAPPKSVGIAATLNMFFCFQVAIIGQGQPDALSNAACMRIVSP